MRNPQPEADQPAKPHFMTLENGRPILRIRKHAAGIDFPAGFH